MQPVVTDCAFVLILGAFLILGMIVFARLCLKAPEAPDYMDEPWRVGPAPGWRPED